MIREIAGIVGMLAGLVLMVVGLAEAGAAALVILGGMAVGTVGTLMVIHAAQPEEPDQDSFDEGVDAPN
jgi:hypothetical protein